MDFTDPGLNDRVIRFTARVEPPRTVGNIAIDHIEVRFLPAYASYEFSTISLKGQQLTKDGKPKVHKHADAIAYSGMTLGAPQWARDYLQECYGLLRFGQG